MNYDLTTSQVARLRIHRDFALLALTREFPDDAIREHFPISSTEDGSWSIPDETLVIVSASPNLVRPDAELDHLVPRYVEGKAEQLLQEVQKHWESHVTLCCTEHQTHAMPHRNCILR